MRWSNKCLEVSSIGVGSTWSGQMSFSMNTLRRALSVQIAAITGGCIGRFFYGARSLRRLEDHIEEDNDEELSKIQGERKKDHDDDGIRLFDGKIGG